MGWLFTQGQTRKELIAHLTQDEDNSKCLKHCTRGNVLWTVREYVDQEKKVIKYIGCDLMKSDGYGWGYKDMSESVHPYYYTCPLSYLKMTPVANKDWRTKVYAYHTKQKRTFRVGQVVNLINASVPQVTIVSSRPLVGTYNGMRYRVPKKMIA